MTNGFVLLWPGVAWWRLYQPETLKRSIGEPPRHYDGKEAKIARSNGGEVIGIEGSSGEPYIAAKEKTAEEKIRSIEKI